MDPPQGRGKRAWLDAVSTAGRRCGPRSILTLLDKHLEGHGYVPADYLIALMRKLPAADPYHHVAED